jgi:uncharacterized SAM-binding protein YcdF (DUF218 family)
MNVLIDEALERRAAASQRWDETLRRVYRETRTRAIQVLIGLVGAYLLVFHTNLVWWAAAPLNAAAPLAPADAIVVFAGGVGESGKAGGGTQERLQRAIDMYKAGYASHLVLSSGYVYSFPEADLMRSAAIQEGVPPAAISLEQRATDTHENVIYVDRIVRERGWRSLLLVTSPYHTRRALLVWRKAAPDVRVIPAPPLKSQFYDHVRGATLDQIRSLLHEYLAIAGYWTRGWI